MIATEPGYVTRLRLDLEGAQRRCNKQHDRALLAEREIERLRTELRRIADSESGHWGWIAHYALHPERAPATSENQPSMEDR